MRLRNRVLVCLLVLTVVLAGVTATGAVTADDNSSDTETIHLGTVDLVLEDEHVHVSDVDASGEGLPTVEIDERTIEVDSATIETDGVTATVRGTTYEIGQFSLGIENVGVTLEDVSITGEK